jgi:hypothetical protein
MPGYSGVRSAGEIVQDVMRDVGEIVRAEVRLARAEMLEKAKAAGAGAGMLGGAAVCGLLGGMCFAAAAIAALSLAMAVWLAAAIVCVLLLAVAGGMYAAGRKMLKQVNPVPERTRQTLKDDLEWAKHHAK